MAEKHTSFVEMKESRERSRGRSPEKFPGRGRSVSETRRGRPRSKSREPSMGRREVVYKSIIEKYTNTQLKELYKKITGNDVDDPDKKTPKTKKETVELFIKKIGPEEFEKVEPGKLPETPAKGEIPTAAELKSPEPPPQEAAAGGSSTTPSAIRQRSRSPSTRKKKHEKLEVEEGESNPAEPMKNIKGRSEIPKHKQPKNIKTVELPPPKQLQGQVIPPPEVKLEKIEAMLNKTLNIENPTALQPASVNKVKKHVAHKVKVPAKVIPKKTGTNALTESHKNQFFEKSKIKSDLGLKPMKTRKEIFESLEKLI